MILDHLFICVEDAAAAEQALADFGMHFSSHAVHPGQGTANACAFFENAYFELLHAHDAAQLRSAVVEPLSLWERTRWRSSGASPFGIAFRAASTPDSLLTWRYHAPFLPPDLFLPIVTPKHAKEQPLAFLIPAVSPIRLDAASEHRGARRRVTGVMLSGPQVDEQLLQSNRPDLEVFALRQAAEPLLELDWDQRRAGESWDFRPLLPLVIRW